MLPAIHVYKTRLSVNVENLLASYPPRAASLDIGIDQAALEACWVLGLAEKLSDVMSTLGGQSVVQGEKEVEAGDYGFRYLVRYQSNTAPS